MAELNHHSNPPRLAKTLLSSPPVPFASLTEVQPKDSQWLWPQLFNLCLHCVKHSSPRLLLRRLAHQHRLAFNPGSLGRWILDQALKEEPPSYQWHLILRALESQLKSEEVKGRHLQITCGNITRWRSDVKKWAPQQGQVVLLQDTTSQQIYSGKKRWDWLSWDWIFSQPQQPVKDEARRVELRFWFGRIWADA